MIGLDTNILLRYLVRDDPDQAQKATGLIERHLSRTRPGFIGDVVLVEMAWVLSRGYRLRKVDLAQVLERLLAVEVFAFESAQDVADAVALMREGHDFADALIGAAARKAGCSYTVTFDRKALRLPSFAAL